jgi:uncharacterized protein YuzE
MLVKKVFIKDVISYSLEFNSDATELFKEINNISENEIIIDFSDIVFISRSFAQAYVSGKIKSSKIVHDVNIPDDVKPMLELVENNFAIRNSGKLNMINLNVDYDASADALSIYFVDSKNHKETIELDDDVYLHFDKNYKPVELEILNASKVLYVNKNSLNKIKHIDGRIIISSNEINVSCNIVTIFRNTDKSTPVHSVVGNNISVPPLNLELAKV